MQPDLRVDPSQGHDQVRALERDGAPFLWLRGPSGEQLVHVLDAKRERTVIGRGDACHLRLEWDDRVSRSHAEIVQVGAEWAIADDGLSANGTLLNGERLIARRRLADRDVIRVGATAILFRHPQGDQGLSTVVPVQAYPVAPLTETQQKVLAALCRPVSKAGGFASPATNDQIAGELFLSVDAIKAHLRTLFGKFAIGDLPQNQKRMRLVQLALESGVVDSLLRE